MRKLPLLLLLSLFSLGGAAEQTRFWRQDKYAEFEKGMTQGVALRSDGEILLAPAFRPLADPNLEFVWAVVTEEDGSLYLGGGSPARVIRIDPSGQATSWFESKELEVHALAFDPRSQTLYAATSPDGSVYRISKAGTAEIFFEPKTKYIWDLVRDAKGNLYVATGDKGEVFRVRPDGTGEVFFQSEETHIRCLALGPEGQVYAGTEPNGLVLRLSPDGSAFVLYEMPRKEVTALQFDSAGNLYVAGIGMKVPLPVGPTRTPALAVPTAPAAETSSASVSITVTPAGTTPTVPITTPVLPLPMAGGSDIYRIAANGLPEPLWSSPTDLVYGLALDASGRLLVGTGNQGKVLSVDSPTRFTDLVASSSEQVTVLVRDGRRDGVLVATANPGKVFLLAAELESEGSFESDVFDAQLFSHWGRISWLSRTANGPGSVRLFTRTGNTSNPRRNWSPWAEVPAEASGAPISSPPARFLQWKAALRATDSRTPSLSSVAVAYLRQNVAPTVESIIVQAPGIHLRGLPAGAQPEPVQLEMPSPPKRLTGGVAVALPSLPAPQRMEAPPQATSEPGMRSVLWSTDDPNEDDLLFSVYYRGEEESQWKLMEENLTEKFYSFEASTLPDGAYFIKVLASDAPSNPPELALTGENISERFEIDNTPPRVENLAARTRSRTVEVTFSAEDSFGTLLKAEYSVDAGEWKALFPLSRTTDARTHSYRFELRALEPGEHTVVVRVYDHFKNPGLAKVTFTTK